MQKILITFIAIFALQACSNLEFPGVYTIPVEQGNVITQEMVDQLKPGMTKSQVEFIMGTALLQSTFNNQRWDYLYSIRRGKQPREQHRLSIFFDGNDQLAYFTGDFQPSTTQMAEQQAPVAEQAATERQLVELSPQQASGSAEEAMSAIEPVTTTATPAAAYWTQYFAGSNKPGQNYELVLHTFGDKTVTLEEDGFNKYLVGPYQSFNQAKAARDILTGMGFKDAFVRKPQQP
jgi:outer membrane protein assembly factor BamE